MNPRHALNGTLYGLQQVRGAQSPFSHALLAGLEALVQEGQGAWTGGSDERSVCAECGIAWWAYTECAWRRGAGNG